ncbi:MAG: hypothetical protein ACK4TI_01920 [Nitrososphaerales archaeon]
MNNTREGRLAYAKIELQSAYATLEQIKPSSKSFKEYKLELWRARSRIELAILLIKLAANVEHEEMRPPFILKAEPQAILDKAKEMLFDSLNDFQDINTMLERVRRVRDLLLLLESGL